MRDNPKNTPKGNELPDIDTDDAFDVCSVAVV